MKCITLMIMQHLTSRTPSLQVFFDKWEARFTKTSRYDCDLQNKKITKHNLTWFNKRFVPTASRGNLSTFSFHWQLLSLSLLNKGTETQLLRISKENNSFINKTVISGKKIHVWGFALKLQAISKKYSWLVPTLFQAISWSNVLLGRLTFL